MQLVMHQFHLGTDEDEQEGEYVVSKIFYQLPKETDDKNGTPLVIEEPDAGTAQVIPRTPKTNTPDPPRPEKTPPSDCGSDNYFIQTLVKSL
ncbi:UNVERIFIED_CONTAM: suppressor of gamma response 1 [Sesamum latifolium]|uniref:Suppressor of gamma response 1 n=1 Tax=Sesamum latifolium TaxID=2727402 RepID=A0AAW2Y7R0_9LAMI